MKSKNMNRSFIPIVSWFALAATALAQGGGGTITGRITDPAGEVIAGAALVARNTDTGTQYQAVLYYGDFRYERHPQENMNLGRTWAFHERFTLQLRVEFNNIFNRTFINNPLATNPFLPVQTFSSGPYKGYYSGGFGYVSLNTSSTQFGQPRNGDIVMKVTF